MCTAAGEHKAQAVGGPGCRGLPEGAALRFCLRGLHRGAADQAVQSIRGVHWEGVDKREWAGLRDPEPRYACNLSSLLSTLKPKALHSCVLSIDTNTGHTRVCQQPPAGVPLSPVS